MVCLVVVVDIKPNYRPGVGDAANEDARMLSEGTHLTHGRIALSTLTVCSGSVVDKGVFL